MNIVTKKRETAWCDLWKRIGAGGDPEPTLRLLTEHYGEAHRAYHTLAHIQACLRVFEEARHLAEQPDEVEFALWFHDAIYDTTASNNEVKSANLADQALQSAGVTGSVRRRVMNLILATRHPSKPLAMDEQIMVDVDLSILGEPAATFDAYDTAIRREYAWVPEEEYRRGRAALLRSFLGQDRIFHTTFFRARLENEARCNLVRALARIENRPA